MGFWNGELYVNEFESFGYAVMSWRKAKYMSQEQLAKKSGLDRTYIIGIEKGKRNPTLKTMIKLADALEVQLVEILHL